ncbi:GntR family transcriptional regulator [Acidovorax sp. SUPP950]|uniref:GntR family transcriptional regulator n=1 Tax=Acidovorax sp. SUPP950 TaxID=511901 RepID=UPI0023BE563A|nr:GntR family transcriptional regulator [Acidovorax sp. SUPP950]GKS76957.1 GntR family transcriptional regulator [Acidovorax sp. SUPP950]
MAEPRYALVARHLSERIAAGEYVVGALLPTELELCDRYGVSRHTVRAAISELQQSGLVSRRKKVGTRVEAATPNAHYQQTLASLDDLVQFGATHVREVRRIEEVVLDRELAAELGCAAGSRCLAIASLRRDGAAPHLPIAWTVVYVDAARFDARELAEHVRAAPDVLVSSLLEAQYGLRIAKVRQDIVGALVPESLAEELQAPAGSAALKIVRRYVDTGGELMDVSVTLHPASRYTLSMQLTRAAV